VYIVNGKARTRESLRNLHGIRRAVFEDGVDQRDILHHLVADLGVVAGLRVPVLVVPNATVLGKRVDRRQIQRRDVHEDEVTAAVVVDSRELIEDAVGVVVDVGAVHLSILDEGREAKIIGADPHGVHRGVAGIVHELGAVRVVVI